MLFKKKMKKKKKVPEWSFVSEGLSCFIAVGGSPFNDAAAIPSVGNFLLADVLPARKE